MNVTDGKLQTSGSLALAHTVRCTVQAPHDVLPLTRDAALPPALAKTTTTDTLTILALLAERPAMALEEQYGVVATPAWRGTPAANASPEESPAANASPEESPLASRSLFVTPDGSDTEQHKESSADAGKVCCECSRKLSLPLLRVLFRIGSFVFQCCWMCWMFWMRAMFTRLILPLLVGERSSSSSHCRGGTGGGQGEWCCCACKLACTFMVSKAAFKFFIATVGVFIVVLSFS